jgi:hypothetical protein
MLFSAKRCHTLTLSAGASWSISKELVADGRILREVILRDAPGKLKFIAGFCPLFSRKSLDWFKGHVTGKP